MDLESHYMRSTFNVAVSLATSGERGHTIAATIAVKGNAYHEEAMARKPAMLLPLCLCRGARSCPQQPMHSEMHDNKRNIKSIGSHRRVRE
ncbi:hypothetical protein ACMFMF_005098 [Clarireedia jacksonii]